MQIDLSREDLFVKQFYASILLFNWFYRLIIVHFLSNIPVYVNLTSDSLYKTLNIHFIYSHSSIVMLTDLQIKSLSERTKFSWSLKLYPAFYLQSQNLEWQHRSSLRQSRDSRKYFYIAFSVLASTFYPFKNLFVDPLSVYGSTSNRTFILVG